MPELIENRLRSVAMLPPRASRVTTKSQPEWGFEPETDRDAVMAPGTLGCSQCGDVIVRLVGHEQGCHPHSDPRDEPV